jgi:hypothetical protein
MNSDTLSVRGLTLLVPEKRDPERDRVGEARATAGGTVMRLGRFWDPPALNPATVRIYGQRHVRAGPRAEARPASGFVTG